MGLPAEPEQSASPEVTSNPQTLEWQKLGLDPETMQVLNHFRFLNVGRNIEFRDRDKSTFCGLLLPISGEPYDGLMAVFGNGRYFHLTPPASNEDLKKYFDNAFLESPLAFLFLGKFDIVKTVREFHDNPNIRFYTEITADSRDEKQREQAQTMLERAIVFSREKVVRDDASQEEGRRFLNETFDRYYPPNHSST